MKPFVFSLSLIIALTLILTACSQTSNSEEETNDLSGQFIEISQQQFETNGMKLGELTPHVFYEEITCNGYINAPANGMAQVSTPLSGIVENIRFSPGEKVNKGAVLCKVSSLELITLQQNYVQSLSELRRADADYKRSKALFEENIGSEKNLINIESNYKSILAKKQALALQLKRLNLNLTQIENGGLYETFPIIAPISGYIIKQEAVLGQYVDQQESLVEIINTNQLQLELAVFEKDVAKLKSGQTVMYKTLGEEKPSHKASLVSIGKSIDQNTKNIQCIAKIVDPEKSNLINRSFVEAKIIVNQKEATALPNEAIIKKGKDTYAYIVNNKQNGIYFIKKVKVKTGQTTREYTEIVAPNDLKNVIVKGNYNF